MPTISRLRFGTKFAGARILGQQDVAVPDGDARGSHLHRAVYLMAQLESPRWGSVQSYDGAGMSGGPAHWVAVLPGSMKQGSIFGLLRRLQVSGHEAVLAPLLSALAEEGWHVSKDGTLRTLDGGKPVTGRAIRETFTPGDGKVGERGSASWKTCARWTGLFFDVLSHPSTFEAQNDHALEYLVRTQKAVETRAYRLLLPGVVSPETLRVSGQDAESTDGTRALPPGADFALCVYHSFSPNAPGRAATVLAATLDGYETWLDGAKVAQKDPDGTEFGRRLIRALGKDKKQNWKDQPGAKKGRYDRTRLKAKRSGLWDPGYFGSGALMPIDLA